MPALQSTKCVRRFRRFAALKIKLAFSSTFSNLCSLPFRPFLRDVLIRSQRNLIENKEESLVLIYRSFYRWAVPILKPSAFTRIEEK
jgi:hypothetical protein